MKGETQPDSNCVSVLLKRKTLHTLRRVSVESQERILRRAANSSADLQDRFFRAKFPTNSGKQDMRNFERRNQRNNSDRDYITSAQSSLPTSIRRRSSLPHRAEKQESLDHIFHNQTAHNFHAIPPRFPSRHENFHTIRQQTSFTNTTHKNHYYG